MHEHLWYSTEYQQQKLQNKGLNLISSWVASLASSSVCTVSCSLVQLLTAAAHETPQGEACIPDWHLLYIACLFKPHMEWNYCVFMHMNRIVCC